MRKIHFIVNPIAGTKLSGKIGEKNTIASIEGNTIEIKNLLRFMQIMN